MWMRQHHQKPIEEVKTDLKMVRLKKYEVCHMSKMEYPEINIEEKMVENGFSQKLISKMWNWKCFTESSSC